MSEYQKFELLMRQISKSIYLEKQAHGINTTHVILSKNTFHGLLGFLPLWLEKQYGVKLCDLNTHKILEHKDPDRKERARLMGLIYTWSSDVSDWQHILV